MHHLPAVTIYNKGGVGGVGVQFGQDGKRRQKTERQTDIERSTECGTTNFPSGIRLA